MSYGAKKVRYQKIQNSKSIRIRGAQSDVYGFLNRITPPRNVLLELSNRFYEYEDYSG